MKRASINRAVICSLILLVIGCGKTEQSPKEILSLYLDASMNHRYEEAYRYISAADKTTYGLQEYLEERKKSESDNPFVQSIESKISYEIQAVTVTANRAEATVIFKVPDLGTISKDILGSTSKWALEKDRDKLEIEKILADEYKDRDMPMKTNSKSYNLVKESDGWKVFLDLKTKKKINEITAQARQLEEEKKLYAAREKYQEVLELDSEMVQASTKIEELDKEIEEFEEKQAYMKNVVLYDLKGKYYTTYLDKKVPGVEFKLKNKGKRTLRRVEVTVYFKDAKGTIIAEQTYYPVLVTEYSYGRDNKPLKPNYIWQLERGKFYQAEAVPSEWKQGAVSAKITDIDFTD